MIFLGIDPGLYGGLAFLNFHNNTLRVYPMPFVKDDKGDPHIDGETVYSHIRANNPDVANIEHVGAMPKDGVVSAFNFGLRTGIVHGTLQAHKFAKPDFVIKKVRPALWKATLMVSADKKQTAKMSHKLLPKCNTILPATKDGLVEASLLAIYVALESENRVSYAKELRNIEPA